MRTIHKYTLTASDSAKYSMPEGADILTVQVQNGYPCIWAMVDTEREHNWREIRVVGTGHKIGEYENLRYIGTFQLEADALVFHVFEVLD